MKTFKEFTSQTQRVNEIAPAIAVGGGAILKALAPALLRKAAMFGGAAAFRSMLTGDSRKEDKKKK